MDISVIIVNFNVRYFLEQCILSVQAASINLKVEIIVVDNNSTDNSCVIIKEKFPNVQLIENKKNIGFAKANNQGVKIAKGKYVLILNPDTVLPEDIFVKILKFVKAKENFGILGVKLIDGTGNFLPESKREIPTPKVSFKKLFGVSTKHTGSYYAAHLGENEIGLVKVLVGAFMFLKKSVYEEVKGFDEDYFMYGEDIDLSYKVLKKGYLNYYFSDTQIVHYKGESTKKDIQYLKHFHSAMKIFYKKHFKRNYLYDFLMNIGIESWYLLKYFKFKYGVESSKNSVNVLYLGSSLNIIQYLEKKYVLTNELEVNNIETLKEKIKLNLIDTVVFETLNYTNKQIISLFEALKNEKVQFKIHPKNTNFLIGSCNVNSQGKIEVIEEN